MVCNWPTAEIVFSNLVSKRVGEWGFYSNSEFRIGNNELGIRNEGLAVRGGGSQIGSWSEEGLHWLVVGNFGLFTVLAQLCFGIFRGGVFCFVKNDGF